MTNRFAQCSSRLLGLLRLKALRLCAGRKRRRIANPSWWQRAIELLTPVSDIATRHVAIHHVQRLIAGIGELMKLGRWHINHLTSADLRLFVIDAHFASALENHVDFLLLLIVPRHLTAIWFQDHVAHGEVFGLNRLWAWAD